MFTLKIQAIRRMGYQMVSRIPERVLELSTSLATKFSILFKIHKLPKMLNPLIKFVYVLKQPVKFVENFVEKPADQETCFKTIIHIKPAKINKEIWLLVV